MIPTAFLRIVVQVPRDHVVYAGIVTQMRQSIERLLKDTTMYAQGEAPGTTLKTQITYKIHNIRDGAEGEVWMPYQLKFTLPPGTKPHLIPGGQTVSSIQQAAQLQMSKGYPLRFYWDRGPRGPGIYFFWAVKHPGFEGGDWADRAMKYLEMSMDEEADNMAGFVLRHWGSGVIIGGGIAH